MTSTNKIWLKHPIYSKSVFLILLASLIWLSSWRMDYNWNWHTMPAYFVSSQSTQIFSDIDGTVVKITSAKKILDISIEAKDKTITDFHISKNTALVSAGDTIFAGDKIGDLKHYHIGPLLKGLGTTIWLSVVASICGLFFGVVLAFVRLHPESIWYGAVSLYIDLVRGTPLLVQLFIIYFFIGVLFDLGRAPAAVLALSLFSAAYFAEILRAGLNSISQGILDAAKVLGLNKIQTLRFISLPITFKRQLPALIGQFINLVKDSSLVSVIAITDLTKAGREIAASNFQSFEVWLTVAALYLLITFSLSKFANVLEKHWVIKE